MIPANLRDARLLGTCPLSSPIPQLQPPCQEGDFIFPEQEGGDLEGEERGRSLSSQSNWW